MVVEGESARIASLVLGRRLTGERPIEVDQSNHSVVVGEEVVVKWLQPPVLAPHPGVQVLVHLAQRGFTDVPEFFGCEVRDELVVATVSSFIADARDGWDWFVDDVDSCLHGSIPVSEIAQWARRLGELTGRLHAALADLQPTTVAARTYHAAARERLDDALRVVPPEEGARLRRLVPEVERALSVLDTGAVLAAHRVHGDLHAGQFLRAGERLLVTDFDGNPLAHRSARLLPQSPMLDLASLVQSVDHVGRIVLKRRQPDRGVDVERVIAAAIAATIDGYRELRPVVDEVMLGLRVAQELHEYCYAAVHLPQWLYIPDGALAALLR